MNRRGTPAPPPASGESVCDMYCEDVQDSNLFSVANVYQSRKPFPTWTASRHVAKPVASYPEYALRRRLDNWVKTRVGGVLSQVHAVAYSTGFLLQRALRYVEGATRNASDVNQPQTSCAILENLAISVVSDGSSTEAHAHVTTASP